MNKGKLVNAILNYLNPSDSSLDISGSKEENFIQNVVRKNMLMNQEKPPEEILSILKIKKNQVSRQSIFQTPSVFKSIFRFNTFISSFENLLKKIYVDGLLRFQAGYIFSAMLILVVLFFLLGRLKPEKSMIEQLASSKQYTLIREGEVLQEVGLRISAQLMGKIAFENKNQREHVYIKHGYWLVDSDYASFDKETWFHFPGGGIKAMGAQFFIEVTSGTAKITLSKGRIQSYTTDAHGVVNKTTIENAPYVHEYRNDSIVSFYESDLLADKSNSMVVQKMDPSEGKEQVSVYGNFIGSYISILQNDGSRLSGTLKKVWNEKLHIQTGTGLVEIPGSNMTLVGLNIPKY